VPSASIDVSRISPAPRATASRAHSTASIVHERPERLLELKAELKEAGWPIRS
jgi:imidazole glycerol phosphate synthase subunit HisF